MVSFSCVCDTIFVCPTCVCETINVWAVTIIVSQTTHAVRFFHSRWRVQAQVSRPHCIVSLHRLTANSICIVSLHRLTNASANSNCIVSQTQVELSSHKRKCNSNCFPTLVGGCTGAGLKTAGVQCGCRRTSCRASRCCTAAALLLHCCCTAAALLLHCCCTAAMWPHRAAPAARLLAAEPATELLARLLASASALCCYCCCSCC